MSLSGSSTTVAIDSIYVDRSERQRKELKNIDSLAQSIARTGLIHFPVIDRDGKLRTGERRWEACKSLGWSHIPVQYADELDEAEQQLLELEENISREAISWQDECAAIEKYHSLRKEQDPTWTAIKTADALGQVPTSITQKLGVARELRSGNQRVIEAPKLSTAKGIVARTNERKAKSAAQAIAVNINPGGALATGAKKPVPLLNEDFHEYVAAYTGPRNINFLHCDFPYGVNADKHDQGQAAAQGGYADGFEVYEKLIQTLEASMSNVVADSAHLMFWFSMDYYNWTLSELSLMGWRVDPFPLVWVKDDNTGIAPDVNRRARRGYETAFMASRGDRPIVKLKTNWFAHPGKDKSIHMSEKPVPMLKHFMEMFVDEYSFVLDPTAGSANALKAASALGAGSVLGLERDTEFFNRAKEAYYNE